MSSDEEDDNSGSDSNVEDDDEDNSGSGSGSGDDDDSDGSGSSGSGSDDDDDSDDSDSDSKKKKKKGDNSNLVPVDITAKPSDELKTILTEMSGVEADVESFFSTLSSDTRNIIGFVPTKHAIRGAYQPPPTQSYSQYNSNNNNNNNIRYSSPIGNSSPNNNNNFRQTQSQYNTYGAYRYQQQDSSSPNSNQLPMAGGAAAMINSPKRRESMEDVAEIQAILAKQHLASGGNKSQHVQNAQNTIAQSQHFGSERFKLNKESQNIIDHYYKNLYSRKAGGPTGLSNSRHNLNYSTVDDLYKASTYKHKAVYDEDDLRHQRSGKFPSSNRSTNDQKFFRGTGSQQQQLQSHMSSSNQNKNQHKIDNAIKVLLGRRS